MQKSATSGAARRFYLRAVQASLIVSYARKQRKLEQQQRAAAAEAAAAGDKHVKIPPASPRRSPRLAAVQQKATEEPTTQSSHQEVAPAKPSRPAKRAKRDDAVVAPPAPSSPAEKSSPSQSLLQWLSEARLQEHEAAIRSLGAEQAHLPPTNIMYITFLCTARWKIWAS